MDAGEQDEEQKVSVFKSSDILKYLPHFFTIPKRFNRIDYLLTTFGFQQVGVFIWLACNQMFAQCALISFHQFSNFYANQNYKLLPISL